MNLSAYVKSKWLFRVLRDFYIYNKCEDNSILHMLLRILRRDIEFFRYNKLLVALAELFNSFSYDIDLLGQRLHRYKVYCEEIKRISYAMTSEDIEFLFIKTVTVFPKDIADLDILVFTVDDLINAEKILSRIGYLKRKKGYEQHLWSLYRDNVVVDVELHTSVAAAGYEYYPKNLLFKNAIKLDDVRVPSPLDGTLLNIAHSVVKDLYITLADLLDFLLTINRYGIDLNLLIRLAKDLGLSIPLFLFLHLMKIFDDEARERLNCIIDHNYWRRIFITADYTMAPIRPGINTLILSYTEMTISKLKYKSLPVVLREILSLPQGKGLDALLHYVMRAKPLVKKISE